MNLREAKVDYFPVNCAAEMWRLLGCFSASPWMEEQNIQMVWMLGRAEVRTPREDRGTQSWLDMASMFTAAGGDAHPASLPMKDGCLKADTPRSLWLMQKACTDTSLSPPSLVHLFSNTENLPGFGLAAHGMRVRLTQLPPAWQLWSQFGSQPPQARSHSRGSRAGSQRD